MTCRLPQNYIPTNYDLYLHIVLDQHPFEASVTITFQKNQDFDKLYLNVDPEIVIKKVTQNKVDLHFTVDYPKLTIERSKTGEMDFDSYPITIEYNVSPSESYIEGFYMCNDNYFTDFEPNGARKLLPCFDEPCIRSTFSIKLLIPTFLTALSNMPIDSIQRREDESEVTFLRTPPMCTYLLCLCIGTFSSIVGSTDGGTLVEFFTSSGRESSLYQYLDVAIYSLNWLEKKFGVKYELPALQLISVEGFPGGMENYGLITLNDYTNSPFSLYNNTVIMHEITHQWFGDLVCIKYWDSLWLNEGFAEFIQYLILNDFNPDAKAFEIFARSDGVNCFNYFEHGVITPSENEVDFDRLFSTLVYSKGAFVLKMFYDLIGEQSFCKVCSNYLNTYKNKCVDVREFVSIASSTLNKDMSSFFDTWLRSPGFPVLMINEIEADSKKVGLTITQICQNEAYYHFNVPILFEKNGKIDRKIVEINDFMVEVDLEYDWAIVNDGLASLCFVVYSKCLLIALQAPKAEGKISDINKTVIESSLDIDAISYMIDDETLQLTTFNQ